MSATVVIPAYQAAAIIGETVRAARRIEGVGQVVVVDDGSSDGTADAARSAGADAVVILPRNRGKGAALTAGLAAATRPRVVFLDADLGASAAGAGPLLAPVDGNAPPVMTVAVLPGRPGAGGFGLAMGLARAAIRLLAGLCPEAPMSGQRGLPRALVERAGIAPGFAVEVGLTVEAAHLGAEIREVPLPLDHARTGRTIAGFAHRARQFRDILWFLLISGYGLGWPALSRRGVWVRAAFSVVGLAIVVAGAAVASPQAALATAAAAAAAVALWLPLLWLTAVSLGLRRENFLGRPVPAAAGIIAPVASVLALALVPAPPPARLAAPVAVGLFGALGLLDDLWGAGHQARGIRGHLLALLRGRVTTGLVKAVGGLAVGVVVGLLVDRDRPWLVPLDALAIALSANLVNLLDLRPGRALKGFALLCIVPAAVAPETLHLVGPLLAAAAVSAPADLAGRAMLGDTGANPLGAGVGVAVVVALPPWARLAVVLALAAVHLLCERASLTEIIAGNRALRFLDRLGTAHLEPLASPARGTRQ